MAARAESAAATLEATAQVLLILSVAGGLLIVLLGVLNPVCPAGALDCYADERTPNISMIGLGIAGILIWVLIWAFAKAVAERIRLAAAVARDG